MSTKLWRSVRRLPTTILYQISPHLRDDENYTNNKGILPTDGHDPDAEHLLQSSGEEIDGQPHSSGSTRLPAKHGRGRKQWYILLLTAILMIMTEFAEFLSGAPQQQVFLEIACRNHYGGSGWQDTTSEKCRVEPVQTELALVDGWKETFDQLPGIILSILYGLVADRIGRKPVLLLGQFGILMSDISVRLVCWWSDIFPLRLIWLGSFWRAIGGGNQVANAMIFVVLADTHDEEHRADAFFKLLAAILISEIIATPLSAALMQKNVWIPMLMSPAILIATILVTLIFLPETLRDSLQKAKAAEGKSGTSSFEMQNSPNISTTQQETGVSRAKEAVRFLLSRRNVVFLLFCFFAATVGRKGMFLLLQFVYKKFGWSFAQASFLISLRGFINLINNLVILPLLTRLLMSPNFRFQLTTPFKDLALSKLAACLLTAGCITLALCSGITTLLLGVCSFALGNSFFLTARSLITSLVPPDRVGVLYTAIGMVSGVGVLIAGPLLAQSFSIGMKIGEAWLGLPYAVSAGLFGMVTVAIWKVWLPRTQGLSGSDDIGITGTSD